MLQLQKKLCSQADVVFEEILQLPSHVHNSLLNDAEVFLIGPFAVDPVRQIQRASQVNNIISIIHLTFPDQHQGIKQAINLAPNIGKNVTVISYELGKDVATVVDSALIRARQRKNFSRIQQQPDYLFPAHRNITDESLAIILAHAPIAAIVFDKNKTVISANIKAREVFSPQLNTMNYVVWNDLFGADALHTEAYFDREEANAALHETVKVNNLFLEISISSLHTEKEKLHYLLLINDITGRVDTENQLRNKVNELEFLNRELDDFINVVSHDFKTPITSISLLAELALQASSPEQHINFAGKIRASALKLRDLLNGLNVLVDIKKNKSEKVEQVDLQERLDINLTDFTTMLDELNGTIQVDFSSAPVVPYFRAHIDSLFSNLITNSIKYRNPSVPPVIVIGSKRQKDYTVITVKDNGIGIDLAKNMNKLFQPFKRLTDQGSGSGLGLSIVKRMIEQDHGFIEVFSEPGEGTTFNIYLRDQY